ncbi:MAG: hypothetical protein M1818_005472 [Claussenomyces sp. TS43310]|nr:MAG: hypothetical protein M1818_005472 [Claussenomyces sp. TS43310]
MGLIKTAIMTGGGIYAFKKIAKAAENRHSNQQPQPDYPPQHSNYPQRYSEAQRLTQHGSPPQGAYYGQDQQRQWGPSPKPEQYDQRYARGYPGDNNPPAYYQQPHGYSTEAMDHVGSSGKDYRSEKR